MQIHLPYFLGPPIPITVHKRVTSITNLPSPLITVACIAERRQDGIRCDTTHGGYRAVQRGAPGGHEAAVGRPRRAGVLRPLQRVPAQ